MSARVLARTCAAEWTRLWTVRATWWCLAAAALVMVGLGVVAGRDATTNPTAEGGVAWLAPTFTTMPAQFAILTLALMAVTADHATGGIVPALQWTPRRGVLFTARTLVVGLTAVAAGMVLSLASALAAYVAARPVLSLPLDVAAATLWPVAVVLGTGALLALGLGFVLRSTAGALVGVFLLVLVLPMLLPQLPYTWTTELADLLPGTSSLYLLLGEPEGRGLTRTSAVLTTSAWAAGALALGWLRLVRSDAHH